MRAFVSTVKIFELDIEVLTYKNIFVNMEAIILFYDLRSPL